MAYTQLISRHTKDGRVEEISVGSAHYLLSIPSGKAGEYRLAQLDDYTQLTRTKFPHHSPASLQLSARASSDSVPGTWGFGFWNDPFGLSLGFGASPFRLPALPNAAWFFGASKENYLSFKPPRTEQSDGGEAVNGFLAQTFRSPKFHPRLMLAGLTLPFAPKRTRQLLGKIVEEDGLRLSSLFGSQSQQRGSGLQSLDPIQWHKYQIDWRKEQVSFQVDDVSVFETPVSPNSPLGLVIWIDNQYAAFTPEGKIGFGVLENPEPAWLEIKELEITSEASSA